jgi:hypothetical protein
LGCRMRGRTGLPGLGEVAEKARERAIPLAAKRSRRGKHARTGFARVA